MNKLHVVQERWAEKRIAKAEHSAAQKLVQYKQQHRITFWIIVGSIIAVHILLSATVVPFLLVFRSFFFDAVVLLTAFIFGMMYMFVIGNVLHLERRHHVLAGIIVPSIAVISVFVLGNTLDEKVTTLPIAVLYGAVFVMPYAGKMLKPIRFKEDIAQNL